MANTQTLSAKEVGALKRVARAQALNALAEEHPKDFLAQMQAYYTAHGLGEYVPEPTPEQKATLRRLAAEEKARQQVEELLEKYPGLKGQIAPVVSVPQPVDEPTDVSLGLDPDIAAAKRGA